MKLALVRDAWLPQVNGVVTTLQRTRGVLEARGHTVTVVSPDQYRTLPCPSDPEIRLALLPSRRLTRTLDSLEPDAIHVATEGPLGLAAAGYCSRRGLAFTTSYHTQFPQYLRKRAPIPETWSYAFLRLALRRPIFAYAGRVAVEKNLDAFLALDLPGTKVVIGDEPDRAQLERRYREARFLGYRFGAELVSCLSAADVFVFPSRTDTFGLVMLEAMGLRHAGRGLPRHGPDRRGNARLRRRARRGPACGRRSRR